MRNERDKEKKTKTQIAEMCPEGQGAGSGMHHATNE
jgi:hypothetical protein